MRNQAKIHIINKKSKGMCSVFLVCACVSVLGIDGVDSQRQSTTGKAGVAMNTESVTRGSAVSDGFSNPNSSEKKYVLEKIPDSEFLTLLEKDASLVNLKTPDSVTREDHVRIACPDGKFDLKADVYYKDKSPVKRRPCVVFMHDWAGGGNPSICGDRQGSFFAINGFVFVALYYRPPKYSPCPAALEDLKTCVRWVRSRADELSIDKDMIVAFGSSAGSQWAYMGAATNGDVKFENQCGFNEFSSDINMVMMHAGICDVVKDFGRKGKGIMDVILGCSYADNPGRYEEFSPIFNVKKNFPPLIIINGDRDSTCSIEAARNLRDKLVATGVRAELVELPGRDHGSTGFPGDLYLKLTKYRDFILSVWKPSTGK